VRVIIDQELCQGHLRCNVVAPELFGVDDIGHGVAPDRDILEGPELDKARAAIEACPEGAIRIEG